MISLIPGIIIGLVIGIFVTGLIIWKMMPSAMIKIHESKLSLDETVASIEKSATEKGWQVSKIYDIQDSLAKAGYNDFRKLKIISMCQPDHAYKILSDDNNKKVSSMMPCRVGVFEDSHGKIFISKMNIGLMSKMFGGTIESVMGSVAEEENVMMKEIIVH